MIKHISLPFWNIKIKDFFFAADLLTVFRQDNYFSTPNNLSIALHNLNLKPVEKNYNIEQMFHSLVVHIMDQCGQSEPFLTGVFVSPDAVANLLKDLILTDYIIMPFSICKGGSSDSLPGGRPAKAYTGSRESESKAEVEYEDQIVEISSGCVPF